jgi:hypothetical protein
VLFAAISGSRPAARHAPSRRVREKTPAAGSAAASPRSSSTPAGTFAYGGRGVPTTSPPTGPRRGCSRSSPRRGSRDSSRRSVSPSLPWGLPTPTAPHVERVMRSSARYRCEVLGPREQGRTGCTLHEAARAGRFGLGSLVGLIPMATLAGREHGPGGRPRAPSGSFRGLGGLRVVIEATCWPRVVPGAGSLLPVGGGPGCCDRPRTPGIRWNGVRPEASAWAVPPETEPSFGTPGVGVQRRRQTDRSVRPGGPRPPRA